MFVQTTLAFPCQHPHIAPFVPQLTGTRWTEFHFHSVAIFFEDNSNDCNGINVIYISENDRARLERKERIRMSNTPYLFHRSNVTWLTVGAYYRLQAVAVHILVRSHDLSCNILSCSEFGDIIKHDFTLVWFQPIGYSGGSHFQRTKYFSQISSKSNLTNTNWLVENKMRKFFQSDSPIN